MASWASLTESLRLICSENFVGLSPRSRSPNACSPRSPSCSDLDGELLHPDLGGPQLLLALREPVDGDVELGLGLDELGLHLCVPSLGGGELAPGRPEVLLGGVELALGLLERGDGAGELLAGLVVRLLGVTELAVDASLLPLEVVLLVGGRPGWPTPRRSARAARCRPRTALRVLVTMTSTLGKTSRGREGVERDVTGVTHVTLGHLDQTSRYLRVITSVGTSANSRASAVVKPITMNDSCHRTQVVIWPRVSRR